MTEKEITTLFCDPALWSAQTFEVYQRLTQDDNNAMKSIQAALEKAGLQDDFNRAASEYFGQAIDEKADELLNRVRLQKLSDIKPEEATWLIQNYIPKGQITLIAGDGGSGKTSLWCNILAAVTTGKASILEQTIPFQCNAKPGTAIFFSSEDSVSKVLRMRLEKSGADLSRIECLDLTADDFLKIKFDAPELKQIVSTERPTVIVFDPLQAFIPANVQMGSRNAMRQVMAPLAALGEAYGTTFLVVVHTNKRSGVWGRNRVADSSDIWDISRSVLVVGNAGKGYRYVSQEKNNYAPPGETILFCIDDGRVIFKGTSDKHDKDFVIAATETKHKSPALESAMEIANDVLSDGNPMEISDFEMALRNADISDRTARRAKETLCKSGKAKRYSTGYGKDKVWYIRLVK